MARIKGGMNAKKKHNRVLKLAKGYRGARSNQYRVAKQSVMRALTSAYAGRKERKRIRVITVELGDLKVGEYRELTNAEMAKLYDSVGLDY